MVKKKTTILIVGINNFIGFHLSDHLSKKFNIYGTLSKDIKSYNKLEKYRLSLLKKKIYFIKYKSPKNSLIKIIRLVKPNIFIFNFFISKNWNNKKFSYEKNKRILFNQINGVIKVLKVTKCKAIIVTGSSEDFNNRDNNIRESFSKPPDNSYGKLKNIFSKKIFLLSKMNKINFAYMRLFSPFGLLDKNSKIFEKLLKNNARIFVNNLKIKRNFTYVKDIVLSFENVINFLIKNKYKYLIINVANKKKVFLCDFISKIKFYFKLNIRIMKKTKLKNDKFAYGQPILLNKMKYIKHKFNNVDIALKDIYKDYNNKYKNFYIE